MAVRETFVPVPLWVPENASLIIRQVREGMKGVLVSEDEGCLVVPLEDVDELLKLEGLEFLEVAEECPLPLVNEDGNWAEGEKSDGDRKELEDGK